MALPMVHIGAAQAALEELGVRDLPAYYLGSIAPDGVHMLDHYTPVDKDRSHLGTRTSHDPAAVGEFLKRLPEPANCDYAFGYAVHVLTDIHWVGSFMAEFDRRYKADPAPALDRKRAYYNDTDQIDLRLYDILPGRKEIWGQLKQAKGVDIPGVLPGKAADLWNRRTLSWYENAGNYEFPVRYCYLEEVMDFISRAAAYSVEQIRRCLAKG